VFLSQWDQTLSNNRRGWALRRNASGQLSFLYSTTGNNEVEVAGAWAPSGDTWYYVAVCRSGTTLRVFIEDPTTSIAELVTEHNIGASSIHDSVTEMRIGCLNSSGGAQGLVGWLDEVRLTIGQGLLATFAKALALVATWWQRRFLRLRWTPGPRQV
jgi:Concanavalin A-like lectin/glucanases superfamily